MQGSERSAAIQLVDYDPDWPRIFNQIRDGIWPSVCDLALAIEHVGSTSVPGISAKPIIDIDLVIKSMVDLPAIVERLTPLDYKHRGNLGSKDARLFFRHKIGRTTICTYARRIAPRSEITLRFETIFEITLATRLYIPN